MPGLPDPNPSPRMDIGKMILNIVVADRMNGVSSVPVIHFVDTPENKYVALISGLNFGADGDGSLRSQMLLEFLTGELGDSEVNILSICTPFGSLLIHCANPLHTFIIGCQHLTVNSQSDLGRKFGIREKSSSR